MTVRYAAPIATNSSLGCFTTLLFRWRGSVYKLIWAEYLVFLLLYYAISLVYRFALNTEQQRFFEKIVNYCDKRNDSVEMSFVLGFFVTSIVSNWWQLYNMIPWPHPVALRLNAFIRGDDDWTKECKRRIMRYCNLNLILTFRSISPPYRRKYPSLSHLVKEGLLFDDEKSELERLVTKKDDMHNMEWLPICWATEQTIEAREKGKITSDVACHRIIEELDKFRHGCAQLMDYETCSVPLVYIQVVTISVYSYFLSCLFGSQWLRRDENWEHLELYFPFFTTLKFIFYMGWLKVAESLINPFGTDDDDFELDEIINRHTQVTCMMVNTSRKDEKGFVASSHRNNRTFAEYVNEGFCDPEQSKCNTASTAFNASNSHKILDETRLPSPVSSSQPKSYGVVTSALGDEESGEPLPDADNEQVTKC